MGLIRNAVTQGWEATNYIGEELPERGDGTYDIAIVGAGPAGLSASLKAMDMGLSYICLEQEDIGGTILTYPRRKLVMTQPMDIPIYGKVKKREMFKEELLDLWNEIISRTGLSVNIQEKVDSITGKAGNFVIRTTREEYSAKSVLLSIGRRGTPRKLGVTGEKSSKVAYRLIEPEQYSASKVLIVGGGDSAIEAATSVSEYNQRGVILSYRQDALSRVKEANRELLEAAVARGRIECLFESEVREIREKEAVLDVKGKSITMENDYVLIFIGGTLPTPFLQEIGINIRTKFGEA
jgi:thioredoxin reductase